MKIFTRKTRTRKGLLTIESASNGEENIIVKKQAMQIEQLLSQVEALKADNLAISKSKEQVMKQYKECSDALEREYKKNEMLTDHVATLMIQVKAARAGKTLLVEDGSIDVDDAESKGWDILVYRQGATPPRYIARW